MSGQPEFFPDPRSFGEEDQIAEGGDLSTERLLEAYQKGIFPWYSEGEPIKWWCPDPRFVLLPADFNMSPSLNALKKNPGYRFTLNQAFPAVIEQCREIPRAGQEGTWIHPEVQEAYTKLHERGWAISAETWLDNELAGGLYGIKMGRLFFGESMFSLKKNASKFALASLLQEMPEIALVDCQVYTPHLGSLGARMISRENFLYLLKHLIHP